MADVDAARRELEAALGADAVLSDPLALRLYGRDASMVEGGCALVALPTTTEQIQACARIAAAHGLPIVPRGSGTGLAGAATPIGDSLVVTTARMNQVLEVRPRDRLAWVEPGLPNLDLPNHLRALTAPPHLALELPLEGMDLRRTLDALESRFLQEALDRTSWNKQQAVRLLGLNRTTLVEMLKRKRLRRPAAQD